MRVEEDGRFTITPAFEGTEKVTYDNLDQQR